MALEKTELAVIGGGPGGYAEAFMAADLGLAVTLIDPEENPGGVCLYRGCIPSKTLLHVAQVLDEADALDAWGIRLTKPRIDLAKLRSSKQSVVAQLTGGLGQLTQRRKITYIRGTARFRDAHTLKISEVGGAETVLAFAHAVIATGSSPVMIGGMDLDPQWLLDSTSALDLASIPKKLLVIGGGYIGLELGSVYAALGAKITLVEMMPRLLTGVDRDLVNVLKKRLKERFDDIRLQTKATEMKALKNGVRCTLVSENGDQETKKFDKVLVAVGRRPNTDLLGLDNTRVQIDDRGFILTDGQQRTAEPHVFAIGDVSGEPMLAHKASHEGRIAVEVIAGREVVSEPVAIPAVVFTNPELAWAGLTETEAKIKGVNYEVSKFPWGASGRAATLGRNDGLTKLLIDPITGQILGAGIVGPNAGEMIAEAVVAMEMGANATDVSLSIHPHPTLSETIKEAAELFLGTATHVYRPKRKKR